MKMTIIAPNKGIVNREQVVSLLMVAFEVTKEYFVEYCIVSRLSDGQG